MLKNKIALKLSIYFAVALLVFSVIIGSVFMVLFRNHTIAIHKADLEKRASVIAEGLSGFMSGSGMGRQGGYGPYLRFINDIAMADVWIVDQNRDLITWGPGMGGMGRQYVYSDLPADADTVISEVFTGKTAFSEDFSGLLKTPTLTVGTPIKADNGEIIGVVLLHSPVNGINKAVSDGFITLAISIVAALLIAIFLSIGFSLNFTRPLNKMKRTALQLAGGDYTAKTDIQQNDEIGELAVTMDILADRLDQASRESEQLEQLRRDFAANISHELRTPVTVIRGSMEALVDGVVTDPEQVRTYHRQILSESLFLQRLVGDLLDLSRLQNADFAIEKQNVNLCDVMDDVTRSMEHIAGEKSINLELSKDTNLCQVIGDYGRLRQMLMIIIDNAIKFSPEKGTVKLRLEKGVLSIIDSGIGISPQHLPHIFDRFYKPRSEQNKSGTGLGLAIAKQIADRHGIHISVESEANVKTEFRLDFNL